MSQPIIEGDPFGIIKGEKTNSNAPDAREVNNVHTHADTDSSTIAIHHTLGIGHNQASPGDHSHDGASSRLVGFNKGLTISGSRGGNAALLSLINMLKNVIDFTDNTTA